MATRALRLDDGIGLAVALAAHAALFAWLAYNPPRPAPLPMPERMTVTLSDAVGLTSTSPEPAAEAAADQAPEEGQPAPQPSAAPPEPQPVVKPAPQPRPVTVVRPAPPPRPVATTPPPRPVPPRPAPTARAVVRQPPTPPKAAPQTAASQSARPGASRIGNDFLKGVQGGTAKGTATSPPAATIGPAVQSALAGAISRQLKPRWVAPQGAEAELLVTILAWDLNLDGTLAGEPRVVRQDGITQSNRPQAARHAEQAIRAVRLAAPFTLPAQYYPAWKRVTAFRFDRKLSQ